MALRVGTQQASEVIAHMRSVITAKVVTSPALTHK